MTILRKKQIRILRKKSESKEKVYILREKSPNSLIQVRILRCISEFCISENLETHVVFIKKQTKKKSDFWGKTSQISDQSQFWKKVRRGDKILQNKSDFLREVVSFKKDRIKFEEKGHNFEKEGNVVLHCRHLHLFL